LEIDGEGKIIYSLNPAFQPGENVMDHTDLTMPQILDVFIDAQYCREQTQIKYMIFYRRTWHQRFAKIYYLIEADTCLVVSEKIPSNIVYLTLPVKQKLAMGGVR